MKNDYGWWEVEEKLQALRNQAHNVWLDRRGLGKQNETDGENLMKSGKIYKNTIH